MITSTHPKRKTDAKLSEPEFQRIKDYIQGAVYCYCKNCTNRFAARDLFGGENRDWNGTPLQLLYDWHQKNGSKDPFDRAAKDLGWLLLDVLDSDTQREFDITEGYTHEYTFVSK